MARLVLVLAVMFVCSFSTAQESYFGIGAAALGRFSPFTALPLIALQAGGPLAEDVELRAQLDTLFFATSAAIDVLYKFQLDQTTRMYIGAGPDALLFLLPPGSSLGFHGTVGLESRPDAIGYFFEGQPFAVIDASGLSLNWRARAGLNFYF